MLEGSLTCFLDQLRQGDPDAAEQVWLRSAPRILAIARKTLSHQPQRFTDSDDAAQSAFFSFWKRATRGDFAGDFNRENFWKLLTTITVRTALKHQQREKAQKRGGGRVYAESSLAGQGETPFRLDQALAQTPVHDFDMICEDLLLQLDGDLRSVALLKLTGHTHAETAELLDCSISSVERKLRLIRKAWQSESAEIPEEM